MAIDKKWETLCDRIKTEFNIDADLNGVLFLIGIREMGWMPRKFTKEEKQDLIDLGTFSLFEKKGYCTRSGKDREGWPMWEIQTEINSLPAEEKMELLKTTAIEYMDDIWQ